LVVVDGDLAVGGVVVKGYPGGVGVGDFFELAGGVVGVGGGGLGAGFAAGQEAGGVVGVEGGDAAGVYGLQELAVLVVLAVGGGLACWVGGGFNLKTAVTLKPKPPAGSLAAHFAL
jgi:hypothetical protein